MVGLDVTGHRVLVAGLGVSGRAAADLLGTLGAEVTTLDAQVPDADLHELTGPPDVDLVIASPGWRPEHPVFVTAGERGIPVWSEVELAWRARSTRHGRGPAPWLAVTGTNGKTTTVGMLASILRAAGLRASEVGNVGEPVVRAATDPGQDVLAVELSSFQLHFTTSMAAQAAAVLNVADDHLDWHGSRENYVAAKAKVYAGVRRACVYGARDQVVESLVREADVAEGARAVGVSLGIPGPGELGLVDEIIVDRAFHADPEDPRRTHSADELAELPDLAHLSHGGGNPPPHIVTDALFASALARAHGVPPAAVRDGLRAYRPAAHRTTVVATVDQVRYVDDSKATNAHAAAAALSGHRPGTVVWLAGGLAKGARFDELVAAHADRLRAAVLIGTDPTPWSDALARHAPGIPVVVVDPTETGTVMTRAVDQASRLAQPGDTVLLAPAGASMDQFASYHDRGEAFAAAVRGLPGAQSASTDG